MAQFVNADWRGPELVWTSVPDPGGDSEQAQPLLNLYEEGNRKAQTGDLQGAQVLFEEGLEAFTSIAAPDARQKMAEAALLWGLGTTQERNEPGEQGWRTLSRILGPGSQREGLPIGLAANWSHSATLAGWRQGKLLEVAALLDALQRLAWSRDLEGVPAQALRERYSLLAPFRARCFEALMREERFEEALDVARRALETLRICSPDEQSASVLWTRLAEAASAGQTDFELPTGEEPRDSGPAVGIAWDGEGPPRWTVGQAPGEPHLSPLARLYSEAAYAADAGDVALALDLYDKGLQAWADLPQPGPGDGVVRAMMLWGKATLQDQQSDDGSLQAWETLLKVPQLEETTLPLPVLLSWVHSTVIVATNLGRLDQVQHLLVFLMEMAWHPELGQREPGLREELSHRFLGLLEGVYGALESDPARAADWVLELQHRVEPPGLLLLPLRDLLYHALTCAGRHQQAEAVATEVLAWARQEGDTGATREWQSRAAAAQTASG
jgi:tetratricopeptide (TPR) repeat protein